MPDPSEQWCPKCDMLFQATTLPPRFRSWSTTAQAASASLAVAEDLAGMHGLLARWAIPDPAGVSFVMGPLQDPRRKHRDSTDVPLDITVRAVIDGSGVVGAAQGFGPPQFERMRRWVHFEELARDYICPSIKAATELLTIGEFLGRARCQVDVIQLGEALLVEQQGDRAGPAWVPTLADIALPATEPELEAIALRAAYAYGRSIGLPA